MYEESIFIFVIYCNDGYLFCSIIEYGIFVLGIIFWYWIEWYLGLGRFWDGYRICNCWVLVGCFYCFFGRFWECCWSSLYFWVVFYLVWYENLGEFCLYYYWLGWYYGRCYCYWFVVIVWSCVLLLLDIWFVWVGYVGNLL